MCSTACGLRWHDCTLVPFPCLLCPFHAAHMPFTCCSHTTSTPFSYPQRVAFLPLRAVFRPSVGRLTFPLPLALTRGSQSHRGVIMGRRKALARESQSNQCSFLS